MMQPNEGGIWDLILQNAVVTGIYILKVHLRFDALLK